MLYIVGTPIGNLNDLSLRQAETISSSDIVLAEDTRSAKILLQGIKDRFSFSINQKQIVISYYKEKEFEKLPQIIEWLDNDKQVSLISESGMPIISDPGFLLVNTCIRKNIPYTVIPGPSAITIALTASGLNPSTKNSGFMFLGFFPKKELNILTLINRLIELKKIFLDMIFVFFESPKRIQKTLNVINNSQWNPDIVIARELTKKFEEIIRGKASQLLQKEFKGELVLLLC